MRFGHFDDSAREYVIATPETPFPWINYLGSEDFFSLISHQAGGYAFFRDAKLRRLTRFRYNNIPPDSGGRYVFINDGGDVWTPTFAPVQAALDAFECRHGLGYTKIASSRGGLEAASVFLVPLGVAAEVHRLTLTNQTAQTKHLKLFSYLEFCLWNAEDDQNNYQRNLGLAEVEVEGSAIYHVTEYRERRDHYAVFGVNAPMTGFDTDRDAFVGRWNPLSKAQAPLRGSAGDSIASGWYPIGSHQVDVELAPGESRDLIFTLGYIENPTREKWRSPGVASKSRARALLARFETSAQIDAALDQLREHWEALTGRLVLESSDPRLNRTVNTWNPYQCMVTFNLSRSASYFETGIGRGMGFRDSNQDLLGFVHMVPERARERLLDIAATQFLDGSAYHQYQPLTKRGNDAIGSGFNDDPLWLVFATVAYVKETGDWQILREPVAFDSDRGNRAPLLDHLQRSVDHVIENRGPHGLPLIGRADWNDDLNLNCFSTTPGESFQTTENRPGRTAESVMIAGMFTAIVPDFAELCEREGRPRDAARARHWVSAMRDAISRHGWDGEWFVRAYDYFGSRVGSKGDDEGQIYLEPQGMCVMGGNGLEDGRARAALDAVARLLATEHGLALLAPAYTRYRIELGEISTYPPGSKENGSVFCHANPWVIIAEAIMGNPGRAFDYYKRITPAYREDISQIHAMEPYVYAQTISGPASPRFGEAKNSWLTGTAAWAYTAATQYLLGIRADFDGLIVEPCLPAALGHYTVTRRFRGATYVIRVANDGSGGGLVCVDGRPVEGNLVPAAPAGARVEVTWSPRPESGIVGDGRTAPPREPAV
ncbi:MAG: glycosyl transferase [Bifidobacteriaceae bacterium]|jgi:cellobiose phosphorylase|nr:glycosyl transferase [Bifidobacteriaceae bacterium]